MLHILRYPTSSVPPSFPVIIQSEYQNGTKTMCARFQNGARVVGQHCENFLYKVKIVLETWEVNKKLIKKSHIFATVLPEAWDKLL